MNLDRPIAPDPYSLLPQVPPFDVSSPAFADGAELPEAQTAAGANLSPALDWSGAPEGTKSYMVTCFDPDAPTPSGFWHWTVVGIPASVTGLAEGAGSENPGALPDAAIQLRNDNEGTGFTGAAPPPGDRAHRYMFAVTALDTADHGVDADTSPAKAHFLTLGNVLARGVVTGVHAEPA